MKKQELDYLGKTIVVKKFNYELRYKVDNVEFHKGFNTDMVSGVVTQATGSSPHLVDDRFTITANEVRVAKYLVLSKSSNFSKVQILKFVI